MDDDHVGVDDADGRDQAHAAGSGFDQISDENLSPPVEQLIFCPPPQVNSSLSQNSRFEGGTTQLCRGWNIARNPQDVSSEPEAGFQPRLET